MGDLDRREFLRRLGWSGAALALPSGVLRAGRPARRPNIIFILADDLGYGDLGCYGQKLIDTPALDRMAAQGTRFTQAYCGAPVCAPSRCSLLTGMHTGHAAIRGNVTLDGEGQVPLPEGTFTVARLLKDAGYATACIGKWGLGSFDDSGNPNRSGFDHFFGYTCQLKAQDHYPDSLWRNGEALKLDGKAYSDDLFTEEAFRWIRSNRGGDFFLYLAYTSPHHEYEVPDLGRYAREAWEETARIRAAMVSRMDRDIGRLLAFLDDLGVGDDTIVFFSSDNTSRLDHEIFESTGGLRGKKGRLYEGGIRVPMIVRWPGHVPARRASRAPWAFWDFLPTCAALAGAEISAGLLPDGVSVAPLLLGGDAPKRAYFYWEMYRGRLVQAARFGNMKAVRAGLDGAVELYDLARDPREEADVASEHPALTARAETILREAHTDSPSWRADRLAPDDEG